METEFYARSLAPDVMVVAIVNKLLGDWCAYVGAVEGKDHDEEFMKVATDGAKIDKRLADILFPDLSLKYTWRR